MRLNFKALSVGALIALAQAIPAAANDLPGDGKTVHYAQSDSVGANYIVAEIVTEALEQLGYSVTMTTINTTLFFPAAARKDLDLATDVNFPQREPIFRQVEDKVQLIGKGLIQGGGINGYLIDKKTADEYGITSLEQMKDPKIAALFGTNGKADLINCDPGWSCGDVVEYQLKEFGLQDTVNSVRGKYDTLMVETIARVNRGEPVFFYTWSPSWINKALEPGEKVVWLPTPFDALPPDVPNAGSALVPGVKGCAGGADPCRMAMAAWNWNSVANKDFIKENPSVEALISEMSFPLETWSAWEVGISEQGGSTPRAIREAAEKWISENKETFEGWLARARAAS
ncbi:MULTISPECIES: glycine betaine/L-proline ABC transporter substrate-binding protein ProX [Chelativorans]|jgi:glycine betaine/proline transport system substrate-binding protein|uniref:Substrate-binding region of ABC-type glycine betaine transport system n=1 Tax=Chelativorans sp. (strain BNC1) TaxID=266779 RepID=Q11FB0_CHESB|nr:MULTISPECIES: glycine betaine/L-proline ABC transporter substrate-binding protein ProX [Chelativorans]